MLILNSRIHTHNPIPSIEDFSKVIFDNPDIKIYGLHNKLIILRRNLALAWSGSQYHAQDAIRFLNRYLHFKPTLKDIRRILQDYRKDANSSDLLLLGSVVFEGKFINFRWDHACGKIQIEPFFVEGSGANPLRKKLSDYVYSKEPSYIQGTVSNIE